MLTTSACGEVRKKSDHNQVVRHLTLDEWQVFADSHPDCTIFHHRNWIKLLVDTYGFQLHIPAVKQTDKSWQPSRFWEHEIFGEQES